MRTILILGLTAVLATGCGGAGRSDVVASFYPLAWAAQAVDPAASVRNLTPPGAEPHDLELTPRAVAAIQEARLVLYLSHGFQPSVAAAVHDARGRTFDALAGARGSDPHVWLDPVRFAAIVRRIGDALGRPRRGAAVARRVAALDGAYRRGLAHCRSRTFVTTHAAFGYLAHRYGLTMVAITGVDPDAEPTARGLESLVAAVRRDHIRTVFFERLASPTLARTVAREADVRTAVLDPIEGLTPDEARAGQTYLSLMRGNLAALRLALGCR